MAPPLLMSSTSVMNSKIDWSLANFNSQKQMSNAFNSIQSIIKASKLFRYASETFEMDENQYQDHYKPWRACL
jgi:hypothetical protein